MNPSCQCNKLFPSWRRTVVLLGAVFVLSSCQKKVSEPLDSYLDGDWNHYVYVGEYAPQYQGVSDVLVHLDGTYEGKTDKYGKIKITRTARHFDGHQCTLNFQKTGYKDLEVTKKLYPSSTTDIVMTKE